MNTPRHSSSLVQSQSIVSDDADEPGIRNQLPQLKSSPSARVSFPVYLLSVILFLVATASSADAHPSPFTPLALDRRATATASATGTCACSVATDKKHTATFAVEAAMIPVLVILSGIFAGLTLGYMSLDTTTLNVLAKTGTPKQRHYAARVIPIRKDGHLLLITLLLANMIVNETLPVIADGVLGGGIQSVVISTALVVIFSEIIPQSVCSRFGLAIGSAMVFPTQILIYIFYVVSWPVARLLTYLLGSHSGVIYRRAELKELISMHAAQGGHGGDLKQDTITIVGATLDLQTKVVSDAMTPLSAIFQLPITSKLDYETLGRVLKAGHSRIPVYEEVAKDGKDGKTKKKVVGVLLTKQLILLDPEDATPLSQIPMNPLPVVSEDLPLLQILNTFQEGRSHMAIVCRRKPGFNPLGGRPSDNPDGANKELMTDKEKHAAADSDMEKGEATGEQSLLRSLFRRKSSKERSPTRKDEDKKEEHDVDPSVGAFFPPSSRSSFSMPLDADAPIGLITLEDVLEELIGEEIYDETDRHGTQEPALQAYIPPEAVGRLGGAGPPPAPSAAVAKSTAVKSTPFGGAKTLSGGLGVAVGRLGGMVRSRSAPGKSRSGDGVSSGVDQLETMDVATSITPSSASSVTVASMPIAQTQEPESLALINEQSGSENSDAEGDEKTAVSSSDSTLATSAPAPAPLGILAPANLIRRTSDAPLAPAPGAYSRPAPPLLSDAVLLERGRRMLVSQGANPSTLPNLRLASPRSQPASRSSTPTPSGGPVPPAVAAGRLVVPPQTAGGAPIKKGSSFKSPPLVSPIPIRHPAGLQPHEPTSSGNTTPKPAADASTSTSAPPPTEKKEGEE